MSRLSYSRDQLLSLSHPQTAQFKAQPVALHVYHALKQHGLCRHPPTRRGCRAGRNTNKTFENSEPTKIPKILEDPKIKIPTRNIPSSSAQRKTKNGIKVALVNAQSVRNKTDMIVDHVTDHELDVVCITESWLCESGDERTIKELTPDGYTFFHVPRRKGCREKHGGGIAILYRSSFNLTTKAEFQASSFENCEITLTSASTSVRIAVIYRRPP